MSKESIKLQAEKFVKRGKLQDAIDEYKKLLTGEEQDVSIWNIIGDLYFKSGSSAKAVEQFKKVGDFYENKGLYSKSIALYKRIAKLTPGDIDARGKLAELYVQRGFHKEAKETYLNLADDLNKKGQYEEAIGFYGKLLKLDPENRKERNILIGLCKKTGNIYKAIEELNNAAQIEIRRKAFPEAKKILSEAEKLKDDDPRIVEATVALFLELGERKNAFVALLTLLEKNRNNAAALVSLGELYYSDKDWNQAELIFTRLKALKPDDMKARFKLGRIHLLNKKPDDAFSAYEPLVDELLGRHKSAKAVGLLGLILSVKGGHIPTLNKLASAYESSSQSENLQLVCRVLLRLYKKQGKKEESLSVYERLLQFFPLDRDLTREYEALRQELGIQVGSPEKIVELPTNEDDRIIEQSLAKVDLYAEQGLIRNAERILSQLKLSFPDSIRIKDRIAEMAAASPQLNNEEIPEVVRKVSKKEADLVGDTEQSVSGRILTSKELFSGMDLFPEEELENEEQKYYDVSWVIEEELQSIERASRFAVSEDFMFNEKGLREIVTEFRTGIDRQIATDDYESRYTLGLAFFDQELFDEAIEEFKTAASEDALKLECFNLISLCFKEKGDTKQALEWVLKTRDLVKEGTDQDWALKYELAELYVLMRDTSSALKLFEEIQTWNPSYREVSSHIRNLRS
ncbi:tetratricopeptide repeat protein [Acidobacteriota bacterium]